MTLIWSYHSPPAALFSCAQFGVLLQGKAFLHMFLVYLQGMVIIEIPFQVMQLCNHKPQKKMDVSIPIHLWKPTLSHCYLFGKPPARAHATTGENIFLKTPAIANCLETEFPTHLEMDAKWRFFAVLQESRSDSSNPKFFGGKNASASRLPCSCKHCCKLTKWDCRNPGNGSIEAAQVVSTWQLSQIYVAWRGISVYFACGTKKSWTNGCIIF